MRRTRQQSNDQRVTVFLTESAVPGRVLRYSQTAMQAQMDRSVPRDEWFRFTLHLPGGVVSGEVMCVGEEDRCCRLQFAALTAADRKRLAPLMDSDE
jgi:hypothetical protein